MTDLPAEVTYGKVVARFLLSAPDGTDPGSLPDALPGAGFVKFEPRQPNQRVTNPERVTVANRPVRCELDAEGYLIDAQGVRGVWLVTGLYDVTFLVKGVRILPLTISVTKDHVEEFPVDLSVAIPPPGPVLGAGQYVELSARVEALETGSSLGTLPINSIDGGTP